MFIGHLLWANCGLPPGLTFKERQKELFKACTLQPEGPSSNSSFITSVHHVGLALPALVSSSTNGYDYSICHKFMRIKWLVHEKHWTVSSPSELSISLARVVSWFYADLLSLWTAPEGMHLASFASLPAEGRMERPIREEHCLKWT